MINRAVCVLWIYALVAIFPWIVSDQSCKDAARKLTKGAFR